MSIDDETEEEARDRILRRIRTEGFEVAYEASLELMRDKNTPAQAKSAAVNATYRAAGAFGHRDEEGEDGEGKASLEEIRKALAQAYALRDSPSEADKPDDEDIEDEENEDNEGGSGIFD